MNDKYKFSYEKRGKSAPAPPSMRSNPDPGDFNAPPAYTDHREGVNNLDVMITGGTAEVATLFVEADDKPIALRYDRYHRFSGTHHTENNSVTLRVYTYLEIKGALWFFSSLLYFILGIFGIFDRIPNRKCRCVDFEMTVDLPSDVTKVTLRLMPFTADGGEAITVETDAPNTLSANTCFVDKTAIKRLKIMRAVKVILTLAVLALAVLIVLKRAFGLF